MAKALGKKELLHWASEETGMPVLSLENLKTGAVLHEVFAVAFPRAVHVRRLQLCQANTMATKRWPPYAHFYILNGVFMDLNLPKRVLDVQGIKIAMRATPEEGLSCHFAHPICEPLAAFLRSQDCIRALRKAGVFDTGAFEQQTVAATTAEPPSPLPRALAPASPGRAVKSGGGSRPPSPRKGPTDPTRTAGGGRPGSPARHPSPPHVDYAPFLWSPATQIRSPRLQNTEEVAVQTSPGMGAIGPPRPPSRSRGLGRQQNENRGWENLVGVGMGSGADAVGAKKAAALAALGPQGRFTAWAKGDRGLASERVEGVPSPSRGEGRTPQLLLGSPRKQLGLETVISSRPENLQGGGATGRLQGHTSRLGSPRVQLEQRLQNSAAVQACSSGLSLQAAPEGPIAEGDTSEIIAGKVAGRLQAAGSAMVSLLEQRGDPAGASGQADGGAWEGACLSEMRKLHMFLAEAQVHLAHRQGAADRLGRSLSSQLSGGSESLGLQGGEPSQPSLRPPQPSAASQPTAEDGRQFIPAVWSHPAVAASDRRPSGDGAGVGAGTPRHRSRAETPPLDPDKLLALQDLNIPENVRKILVESRQRRTLSMHGH